MRNNLFSPHNLSIIQYLKGYLYPPQHDWKNYSVIKEREALP